MTYKKRFQKIRTDYGLSREEFAKLMRVDEQTVLEWENGLEQPKTMHFIMVNRIFNVPLNELIKDIPVPERKPISLVKKSECTDKSVHSPVQRVKYYQPVKKVSAKVNSVNYPVKYDYEKVQMNLVRKKAELIKRQKEKESEKYQAVCSVLIFIIFVMFLLLNYFD